MKDHLIILIMPLFVFISCSGGNKPAFWPKTPSALISVTYEMKLADSLKLLVQEGDHFNLPKVADIVASRRDTIFYNIPPKDINRYFPGIKIRTAKTYSSNHSVNELYIFDKGAVKLAGYTTGDSLMPVTAFSNPLVIFPSPGVTIDSTIAEKKNWVTQDKAFREDVKTRTIVRLVKSGELLISGVREDFILYQLTLTSDAKVAFGKNQLIVPDAIYMQSYMVVGKTKGLLCEWSIKNSPVQNRPHHESDPQQEMKSYIEFITYNPFAK
jgi:hypothetical protein